MTTNLQCPICRNTERSMLPASVCEECGCDMIDQAIALNKGSSRADRLAAAKRLASQSAPAVDGGDAVRDLDRAMAIADKSRKVSREHVVGKAVLKHLATIRTALAAAPAPAVEREAASSWDCRNGYDWCHGPGAQKNRCRTCEDITTPPTEARDPGAGQADAGVVDIREGEQYVTADGRTVFAWTITADNGVYCSDLQHHCASTLRTSHTNTPGAGEGEG